LALFKDCENCPDMIVVPSGEFTMGSPPIEPGRGAAEGPVRKVTISKPFAAARYAVTLEQFEAFVAETKFTPGSGCRAPEVDRWVDRPELSFRSPGFAQSGQNPVVCVAFADAKAYAVWLSAKSGKPYRVLSEAEREYVARAGTTTAYWWGDSFDPRAAAHDTSPRPTAKSVLPQPNQQQGTTPVQSFRSNPWGFFQVHGNVAEWTQDCWSKTLTGLPVDGAAAATGDCAQRVLRGGGWNYWPEDLRAAYREAANAEHRFVHVGFRLARDIDASQR
jgi:formylglycine-generating enzyme required for sulfatase activity